MERKVIAVVLKSIANIMALLVICTIQLTNYEGKYKNTVKLEGSIDNAISGIAILQDMSTDIFHGGLQDGTINLK